jgi:hypothetical protein
LGAPLDSRSQCEIIASTLVAKAAENLGIRAFATASEQGRYAVPLTNA